MAELAKRIFAALREVLLSYEPGALSGEVEAVHDMRVTARRLRVALSNFAVCLPLELRRQTKLHLNHLADTLGRVRDIDVMLESLEAIELEIPPSRKAMIADLGKRLVRRRRYHFQRLVVYLQGEQYEQLKRELPELQTEYGQTL